MSKFSYMFLTVVGIFAIFSFLYVDFKKCSDIEESLMLKTQKNRDDDDICKVYKPAKQKVK